MKERTRKQSKSKERKGKERKGRERTETRTKTKKQNNLGYALKTIRDHFLVNSLPYLKK